MGGQSLKVSVTDAYSETTITAELQAGQSGERTYELNPTHGWYDFVVTVESDATFRYQLAGHVETGKESRTDPAIGTA